MEKLEKVWLANDDEIRVLIGAQRVASLETEMSESNAAATDKLRQEAARVLILQANLEQAQDESARLQAELNDLRANTNTHEVHQNAVDVSVVTTLDGTRAPDQRGTNYHFAERESNV